MTPASPPAGKRKTYSHLAGLGRMPSEYEITTSRLHYYTERGFEVAVPVAGWYERYQRGSPLRCADWERFADPRATTYTKYTALQRKGELFIDGLLQSIDELGYDRALPEGWLPVLGRVLAPSRFLFHGLQMLAAYIGQMAPAGRITIAAALQAADELRRVQRVAYRMRQLAQTYPGFGQDSRERWQSDPLWQPAREVVERLLVTYDWGEALVGVNLVLKPLVDDLLMVQFGALASRQGDTLLREIFFSLNEDCKWQKSYTYQLLRLALEDSESSRPAVERWVERWSPLAWRAVEAFAPAFGEPWGAAADELRAAQRQALGALGIQAPAVGVEAPAARPEETR